MDFEFLKLLFDARNFGSMCCFIYLVWRLLCVGRRKEKKRAKVAAVNYQEKKKKKKNYDHRMDRRYMDG